MQLSDMKRAIAHQPFRPFRVFVSDGSSHEISDPDHVLLFKHTLIIGLVDDGEDVPERAVYCDTMHITRLETVEPEPPADQLSASTARPRVRRSGRARRIVPAPASRAPRPRPRSSRRATART